MTSQSLVLYLKTIKYIITHTNMRKICKKILKREVNNGSRTCKLPNI